MKKKSKLNSMKLKLEETRDKTRFVEDIMRRNIFELDILGTDID